MSRKKTVLVVVAHADDMEFMAGGTIARFTEEYGYDVYGYILTDNRRGSYRIASDELIAVSAAEAEKAGRILGLREVRLEGYPDGELNEVHPNTLREKVMAMIREVRADIVMSWDPFAPGEDHPDHRMTAFAALDAAAFSGNPLFHPEQPHDPWPVTEAYWFAKHPRDAESFVDISSTIDTKIKALLAHDCQMAMTFDALRQEAAVLEAAVPALQQMDPENYAPLVEMGVRMFCERIGTAAGMAAAEQFRYQSFSMLDDIFGLGLVKPDFGA
jgi:LmbE family N-acetylglucosaminyl deacetylase